MTREREPVGLPVTRRLLVVTAALLGLATAVLVAALLVA